MFVVLSIQQRSGCYSKNYNPRPNENISHIVHIYAQVGKGVCHPFSNEIHFFLSYVAILPNISFIRLIKQTFRIYFTHCSWPRHDSECKLHKMYLQQINEGFKVESLIFWRGLSETDTSSTVAENLGTFSNTEFLVLKLSPCSRHPIWINC